jgi:long-chain acyl-CoA synthetase
LIYDKFVFKSIKNLLGGKIRFFLSAGAPLNDDVRNYLTVVFQAPFIEAYGITETGGILTSTCIWDRKGQHVGGILPCNRMQLRDVPELNISTDLSPPTGAIYTKGNSVMKGYFKNPQLTKQVLSEDGWLKVGDIATMNPNGCLQIIDRLSELKKLQCGQMIAPSKLESAYIEASLVHQIFVDVNPEKDFLVAIVTVEKLKLLQYIDVNGICGSYGELIHNEEVKEGIIMQLDKCAKIHKFNEFEKIKKLHVHFEPFSF